MKRQFLIAILAVALCASCLIAHADGTAYRDVLGTIDADTYTNPFIGLECRLEGWKYLSQEEMLRVYQMIKDNLSDTVDDLLLNADTVPVMMASSGDGKSISIAISGTYDGQGSTTNADVKANLESQIEDLKAAYEASGDANVQMEVGDFIVAGQAVPCLRNNYTNAKGSSVYTATAFYVRNNYIISVAVTSLGEDRTDEVFSKFHPSGEDGVPATASDTSTAAPQYASTQSFLRALDDEGIYYTFAGISDGNEEMVDVVYTLSDTQITVRLFFGENLDYCSLRVWDYIIYDPQDADWVVRAVDKLNLDYNWVKFFTVPSVHSVTVSMDVILGGGNTGRVCREAMGHIVDICDTAYSSLKEYDKGIG